MEEDFEAWESYYELHQRQDYPALVALCEREVASSPGDLHAIARLGEAYVWNKQHQEAVDLMGRCHAEHPDIEDFSHILLDALFALGKTEDDFPWKIRPEVLRIGPEVADFCFDFLRPRRKPRSVDDLYFRLMLKAYLAFTKEDLMAFLQREPRFLVEGENPWDTRVRIDRSRKGKGSGRTSTPR